MSKYEVKGVKSFPGHDGALGFSANLYRDGKKVASVFDSAHGGCYEYRWVDWEAPKVVVKKGINPEKKYEYKGTPEEAKLAEHIKGMKYTCPYSKKEYDLGEDMFVGGLVDEYESEKKFKRVCRTKTVVKLKSDDEGAFTTFNVKYNGAQSKEGLEKWAEKNGEEIVEIVNERYAA